MKKIFFFIFLLNIMNCSKIYKLEKQIIQESKKNSIIDLYELTNFEWDEFYIFYPLSGNKEISDIINQNYCKVDDNFLRTWIFLNNEMIVFDYVEQAGIENFLGLEFGDEFVCDGRVKYLKFVNSSAKFNGEFKGESLFLYHIE